MNAIRLSKQLDIAIDALNSLSTFRLDPNRPIRSQHQLQAIAKKALHDLQRLQHPPSAK